MMPRPGFTLSSAAIAAKPSQFPTFSVTSCKQQKRDGLSKVGFFGTSMTSSKAVSFFSGSKSFRIASKKSSNPAPKFDIMASAGAVAEYEEADIEFLSLGNLAPAPGSRRKAKRKGRGIAAGQGATCGFGMRGQNSRSGRSTRPGFEGGQTPLYRRIPKLKGIAGGMSRAVPKFNILNVGDLQILEPNTEVTMEAWDSSLWKAFKHKPDSGLPLKILGDGDLSIPIKIVARAITPSAKEKIEAAGGSIEIIPGKTKWQRDFSKPKPRRQVLPEGYTRAYKYINI